MSRTCQGKIPNGEVCPIKPNFADIYCTYHREQENIITYKRMPYTTPLNMDFDGDEEDVFLPPKIEFDKRSHKKIVRK